MKKSGKLRLCLATESPTFSNIQLQECNAAGNMSPMTDLAANLSVASLATPPVALKKRRLSLSSSDGTPTPIKDNDMEGVNRMEYNDENRLLRGGVKITGLAKDQGSFSRNRGFSRRIVLTPVNSVAESNVGGKENKVFNFPMPSAIISTVHTISPAKSPSHLRHRYPLEDYDPNSQDSGYGTSYPDKDGGFRFVEPFALPPRRQCVDQSPRKDNSNSPKTKPWHQVKPPHSFQSLSSGSGGDSMDDGFLELFEFDRYTEDANLPFGLSNLLSNPIAGTRSETSKRNSSNVSPTGNESSSSELKDSLPPFQRSFSFGDTTPNSSRARSCLFKMPNLSPPSKESNSSPLPEGSPTELTRNFKRPEPPSDGVSPAFTKRRKFSLLQSISENATSSNSTDSSFRKPIPKLQRSFSESEASIMRALHRSTQEPDLIGDFTQPYLLPLIDGRHQDLKTISPNTLAELMNGKYDDSIAAYSIVDCRYPYEFNGGHINGARNMYTKEQILKHFIEQPELKAMYDSSHATKRKHILIFHCEFSSERGPGLYRFLRNCDRDQNKECYPTLSYPELYLLEGGYKSFFNQHGHLCEPQAYRPMLHPDNEGDLRTFRAKSKSWSGDTKSRLAIRSNLKRLGL